MAGAPITKGLLVTVQEAGDKLAALVEQALGGQDVILTRGNEPLVRLVPVPRSNGFGPIIGSARGTVLFMADDFDAPLADFVDYT